MFCLSDLSIFVKWHIWFQFQQLYLHVIMSTHGLTNMYINHLIDVHVSESIIFIRKSFLHASHIHSRFRYYLNFNHVPSIFGSWFSTRRIWSIEVCILIRLHPKLETRLEIKSSIILSWKSIARMNDSLNNCEGAIEKRF